MKLSDYTVSLLNDIERRIDPETEDGYYAQWENFWSGAVEDSVFTSCRAKTSSASVDLREVHINDTLHDLELMLISELVSLSKRLSSKSSPLGIRANYGTGIIPSLFGADIFEMPRNTCTLPTTKPFDVDKLHTLCENGIPDLKNGFGASVLAFGELCAEIFDRYPKIKKYVNVYHPDTQGPLDITELLMGSEMFYQMYDDPEFVHTLLRTVTDTYKSFLDRWFSIIPNEKQLSMHWNHLQRGNIMIRLDSAMNLSVDFYNEYSKPYDNELLNHFGGGCMHFCGRGDHFVESMCELEKMYGFNMSQPHLNDMDKIFAISTAKNKKILNLPHVNDYVTETRVGKGLVHGI
ncbi:MAG: hypothetical protein E7642_07395 [Ruminococcaceae bacterium]|nr:hypothetical protein [Oscillospiraceae bacterium]